MLRDLETHWSSLRIREPRDPALGPVMGSEHVVAALPSFFLLPLNKDTMAILSPCWNGQKNLRESSPDRHELKTGHQQPSTSWPLDLWGKKITAAETESILHWQEWVMRWGWGSYPWEGFELTHRYRYKWEFILWRCIQSVVVNWNNFIATWSKGKNQDEAFPSFLQQNIVQSINLEFCQAKISICYSLLKHSSQYLERNSWLNVHFLNNCNCRPSIEQVNGKYYTGLYI